MYTLEELEERLRQGGLPIDTWGLPGTATKEVPDLLREVWEGSAAISTEGPVSCSRHSVCTEVTYVGAGGIELVLFEAKQVFPDGTPLERNLYYLRESLQKHESFSATACRGLYEELDILVDPKDIINENETRFLGMSLRRAKPRVKRELSKVYPGLDTVRTEWHVSYVMHPQYYNASGYSFCEHGITTYFEWRPYTEKPPTP